MEGDAGTSRLTQPTPEADNDESAPGDTIDELTDESVDEAIDDDTAGAQTGEPEPQSPTEDAALTRRPSRLDSRAWVAGVCTVLLAGGAAIGVAGYLLLRSDDSSAALQRAEDAAVAAAKDCVTATQAPDLATMAASQQKIIDCATGDFGAQAMLYSGVLVDAYQAAQAQVQVSDIRAAVERHNDDGSIVVLVALRATVSNSAAKDQESGYRLRVQMAPDAGTYKIARLDQVTQ